MRKTIVLVGASLALTACDKPSSTTPPPAAPASAAPTVPTSAEAAPAQPDWAKAYLGRRLADVIPGTQGSCTGSIDKIMLQYRDGAEVVGWGWDLQKKDVVARVVIVDAGQTIIAGGETGMPRPDVNLAKPEITSPTTGWKAVVPLNSGGVDAFGLTDDGKSTCRLGHLNR